MFILFSGGLGKGVKGGQVEHATVVLFGKAGGDEQLVQAAGGEEGIRKHYGDLFNRAAAALAEAKAKDPKATAPADPMLAEAHAALNDVAGLLAIPDRDADAFDGDVKASLNSGMNAHLNKPISPEKLYETLAKFMH